MVPKELLGGLMDEKKQRILKFFINNPDEKFYLREVGRAAKVPPATTYRIINRLLTMDILELYKLKRTKLYVIAKNSKTEALREIFEEKKTAVQEFVEYVSKLDNVERIILHGEESKDKTSLLIVGTKVDAAAIKVKVGDIKEKYNISIIDLTLTSDQFHQMTVMGLFPGEKTILWPKQG